MKRFKKILAMLLAVVMVLSLAACGSKAPADDTKPVEVKPADTENQEAGTAEREHVELVLYNYMNADYPGWKETQEAINVYLKEKLNTTIEWHTCVGADYNSLVSTHVSSGGYFDLALSRPDMFDFMTFVALGAFYPIDDLVDEYLPGTKEQVPEAAWDAMQYEGHQYGVPLPRDSAVNFNIQVNQTMLDDLGLTVPEYRTAWDLVDWIYEAKAARDAKYPEKKDQTFLKDVPTDLRAYYTVDYHIARLIGINVPGAEGFASQGDKAFCTYLTDEYRVWAKQMNQFAKDNIVPFDPTSFDTDNVLFKAGEFLFKPAQGTIFLDENINMPGFKTTLHRAKDGVLATPNSQNGYVISANSKYPERALEVVELFNTDPYVATMLHFGPENIGWTDTDNDGIIEPGAVNDAPVGERYYWHWYGWNLGGLTVSKLPTGYPANFVDLLKEMNNSAIASPAMGFSFDSKSVANELAAVQNVVAEYENTIKYGQYDDVDKIVDEFVAKLKANGIEKIVDEFNAQLDAFYAAK